MNTINPGEPSMELMIALGMDSEKDPPPYLEKLIKVGIPAYCKKSDYQK